MRHASTPKAAFVAKVLASFLIATSAHATCAEGSFDDDLGTLLTRLTDCQSNPRYLAKIGHLLNEQGRYQEALEHLERSLLFDPDLPETQLDYAIALAGTGDTLSASQLLDGILVQPQLSPSVRRALTVARQRLVRNEEATATEPTLSLELNANLRQGFDSNLLGTTHIKSLALTLPDQIVVLPLADSSAPRAGSYTRADARLELSYKQANASRWDLSANAMQRNSPAAPEANTQQIELVLDHSPSPNQPWAPYFGASQVHLATNGGTRYNSQGITAGLQLPSTSTPFGAACISRAGLEWQNRNFASTPVLSGIYTGLSALWTCATAVGGQWQLSAKLGQDRPLDPNRPGGKQNFTSVRSVGIWPASAMGLAGALLLDLDYTHTRDATGYSPLLDNAAVRTTRRVTTRLEYQRPLSRSLRLTVGSEWSYQDSNLELFKVRGWGPYAALQAQW